MLGVVIRVHMIAVGIWAGGKQRVKFIGGKWQPH